MAVNEQFSGNVVDSSEQPLPNIRYRGYHTNTNTWSDWYYSNNYTQYNINLGDAAWLSQQVMCQLVMLCCWYLKL